ncbi:hypothetical protein MKW92_051270 [Papaver armeniacum]|nr:hypothetical protein MKW92_051270 [Papaver armeniacum]
MTISLMKKISMICTETKRKRLQRWASARTIDLDSLNPGPHVGHVERGNSENDDGDEDEEEEEEEEEETKKKKRKKIFNIITRQPRKCES